ncbi:MAG: TetR/AcrR family transcriptional regulator [Alphaproteobacteria bacterium]
MIRNRRDTEDKLVRAVGAVLEISGFQKVGVNLLARTAGVDKVLIYRYFGGLDGLLSAFGESADIWWTVDEIVGDETAGPEQGTYPPGAVLALDRQVDALRQRPVTQQILLWELSQSNGLTRKLNELRETRTQQLVRRAIELGGRRVDTRLLAVHSLLGAASEYGILRSRNSDSLLGMDFSDDAGWSRLAASLSAVAEAVLAEGEA